MISNPHAEIRHLCCGPWEAGVLPSVGANLVYLRNKGKDVLQNYDSAQGNPFLFGTPILLPAKRTKDGVFSFRGKRYSLPITDKTFHHHMHGCLMKRHFQVIYQDNNRIQCRYHATLDDYPFPFILTTEAVLSEESCRQRIILNLRQKFPFGRKHNSQNDMRKGSLETIRPFLRKENNISQNITHQNQLTNWL